MLYILLGVAAFALFIFLLWGFGKLYGEFVMAQSKTESQIATNYKDSDLSKSSFIKKYPEASIGNHKKYLLALGFLMSFGASIYALSYRQPPAPVEMFVVDIPDADFEQEPPPTEQVKPPPPPPPPPEIEVVEDEEILEDEPELETVELEEDEIIEVPEVIEVEEVVEDEIFTAVEDMPIFPGCEGEGNKAAIEACHQQKLLTYLAKTPYPLMAKDNDIEGKVFVRFVIDKTGKVTDVSVARSADKLLDAAAVKQVKNMAPWTPGKQRGKPVKVQYIVPINFKLG